MSSEEPASKPEWREFEKLVADIQRQLAPQAKVSTNVRLVGKTQIERQVDILVEQSVGQYEIRVVIDCKDYKRPLDIKDVEQFIGMVQDLGANKGAMVAAHGFSSAAKQRAKDAGIDLYRLVDTGNTKWRTYVSMPCVIRDIFIDYFSFRFSGTGYFKLPIPSDWRYLPVFRVDGTLIDYLQNLVVARWEDGDIPATPGEHTDILAAKEQTFMKAGEGEFYPFKIEIRAKVAERLYWGQLPIEETKGFKDELKDGYMTTSFTTGAVDFQEIEMHWERIASIDQLAVQPTLSLRFKSVLPRFEGTDKTPI